MDIQINDELPFAKIHNITAFLKKPHKSEPFHEVIDLLRTSHINYALVTRPPHIYVPHILNFWDSATVNEDETALTAIVDGRPIVISEESIRRHLQLNDANGITSFSKNELCDHVERLGYPVGREDLSFLKNLKGRLSPPHKFVAHTLSQCMSSKKSSWNEINSDTACGIVCILTNQVFNFSNMIFLNMLKNLRNKQYKFCMYPRFLQIIFNNEIQNLSISPRIHHFEGHKAGVFSQMKRVNKVARVDQELPPIPDLDPAGEGQQLVQPQPVVPQPPPAIPAQSDAENIPSPLLSPPIEVQDAQPIPSNAPETVTQLPLTFKRRKTKGAPSSSKSLNLNISEPNEPEIIIPHIGEIPVPSPQHKEVVSKEGDDHSAMAATTAASLSAAQDSGNSNKTLAEATSEGFFSLEFDPSDGPRRQESMGVDAAQARPETSTKNKSKDPSDVGTPQKGGEDSYNYTPLELMEYCGRYVLRVEKLESMVQAQSAIIQSQQTVIEHQQQQLSSQKAELEAKIAEQGSRLDQMEKLIASFSHSSSSLQPSSSPFLQVLLSVCKGEFHLIPTSAPKKGENEFVLGFHEELRKKYEEKQAEKGKVKVPISSTISKKRRTTAQESYDYQMALQLQKEEEMVHIKKALLSPILEVPEASSSETLSAPKVRPQRKFQIESSEEEDAAQSKNIFEGLNINLEESGDSIFDINEEEEEVKKQEAIDHYVLTQKAAEGEKRSKEIEAQMTKMMAVNEARKDETQKALLINIQRASAIKNEDDREASLKLALKEFLKFRGLNKRSVGNMKLKSLETHYREQKWLIAEEERKKKKEKSTDDLSEFKVVRHGTNTETPIDAKPSQNRKKSTRRMPKPQVKPSSLIDMLSGTQSSSTPVKESKNEDHPLLTSFDINKEKAEANKYIVVDEEYPAVPLNENLPEIKVWSGVMGQGGVWIIVTRADNSNQRFNGLQSMFRSLSRVDLEDMLKCGRRLFSTQRLSTSNFFILDTLDKLFDFSKEHIHDPKAKVIRWTLFEGCRVYEIARDDGSAEYHLLESTFLHDRETALQLLLCRVRVGKEGEMASKMVNKILNQYLISRSM